MEQTNYLWTLETLNCLSLPVRQIKFLFHINGIILPLIETKLELIVIWGSIEFCRVSWLEQTPELGSIYQEWSSWVVRLQSCRHRTGQEPSGAARGEESNSSLDPNYLSTYLKTLGSKSWFCCHTNYSLTAWSTLIGREMSRLGSHWSRALKWCLHYQSYAIKNQLGH